MLTEPLIQYEIDYAALEKITPKELNADNDLISRCQDYLETRGNTLALIGKLGSGKRTIASQITIRLAKKDKKLKIKIVRNRDVISEGLKTRHSTFIIINNPFKTWFTSKHVDEIIGCLLDIYVNAKINNSYIIAIFDYNDWNSFKSQIGDKNYTMKYILPERESICNEITKMTEMAKSNNKDISSVRFISDERNIGDPLMVTLFLKNSEFKNYHFLSNPTKFVFEKLKTLEKSSELAFKIMGFFVFHNEEIAKTDLDDISLYALFADLKKMDDEASINGCIEHLLDLFIEETADGRSYRILHDVITRCTFLAAFENHMTLLLTECNPILLFDCTRVKSTVQKLKSGQLAYDFSSISVGIPSDIYPEVARLIYQRTGMSEVLQNSKLYEDKKFQDEWNKTEQYFTNEIHVENKTVN
ncbi:uncharacterized protein LOC128176701 [Crassostrea angulata]|uniref:uncharacterized protein LOC128176701 n=1 Tax=Magallana angulata TaxID=2784310 RepID=UPI0022B1A41A|nr:uncharacterized protein LOC128176701 [Crassostrea angulata]